MGIEGFTDTAFMKPDGQNDFQRFIFLLDVHSRMLFAIKIDREVKLESLKQAYTQLFKQGMPKFPIICCDPSLNKLASTYFANIGILLRARRSMHHMAFLEGIIRSLKKNFIQNLRKMSLEAVG